MDKKDWNNIASVFIVLSIVCGICAFITDGFYQTIDTGFLGKIRKYPYRQYTSTLSVITVVSVVIGIASLIVAQRYPDEKEDRAIYRRVKLS